MKIFTSLLLIFASTMGVSAFNPLTKVETNSWNQIFYDYYKVSKESDIENTGLMAQDANGNTFFAGLINEEELGVLENTLKTTSKSVYLSKYSDDGRLLWDVSFFGTSVPTAITTDAEGNVYLAGNFASDITFTDVKNNEYKIDSESESTDIREGFLAKYDKDGNYLKAQAFTMSILDQFVDNENYYAFLGDLTFHINSLDIFNDKIILGTHYCGKVTMNDGTTTSVLPLEGGYYSLWGFAYADSPINGIFSLDKDLTNPNVLLSTKGNENDGRFDSYGCRVKKFGNSLLAVMNVMGPTTLSYGSTNEPLSTSAVGDAFEGYTGTDAGYLTVLLDQNFNVTNKSLKIVENIDIDHESHALTDLVVNDKSAFWSSSYKKTNPADTTQKVEKLSGIVCELDPATLTQKNVYNFTSTEDIKYVGLSADGSSVAMYIPNKEFSINNHAISSEDNHTVIFNIDNTLCYLPISNGTSLSDMVFKGSKLMICGSCPYVESEGAKKEIAAYAIDLTSDVHPIVGMNAVKVYPNPTADVIFFNEAVSGAIFAIDGTQVANLKEATTANLAHLNNGTYILKATTKAGESIVTKLIKK